MRTKKKKKKKKGKKHSILSCIEVKSTELFASTYF